MTAACGGSSGPLPTGPAIACPAGRTAESLDGQSVTVAYDLPQAVGGTGPIAVTCAPPPGSSFGVGATAVTCTAIDARGLNASCAFVVTVLVPRLSATRFLAFGDSLTYGATSPAPTLLLVFEPDSYPFKLQQLLAARYRMQAIEVLNDGVGGENVATPSVNSPGGTVRLPGSLAAHQPQVLLLMEGTNDLLVFERGAAAALAGLEQMVQLARGRGVRVLLATIPPQRPGGRRDRVAALIPSFNESIRQLAAREAVPLVDVHNALKDRLDLIGVDDLHPTAQGYDVIAATFFDAIKAALEVRAASALH